VDRDWLSPRQLSQLLEDAPTFDHDTYEQTRSVRAFARVDSASDPPDDSDSHPDGLRAHTNGDHESDRPKTDVYKQGLDDAETEAINSEDDRRPGDPRNKQPVPSRQSEQSNKRSANTSNSDSGRAIRHTGAESNDHPSEINSGQTEAGPAEDAPGPVPTEAPVEGPRDPDDFFHAEIALLKAARGGEPIRSERRFIPGDLLGQGGSGSVLRAYDRVLSRTVAMKLIDRPADRDPEALSQFLAEAQATGQLEHPNIVPVYNFGVLESGKAFYTMQEVKGDSLREVLHGLRHGDPDVEDEYTMVRLINILRQVSQAVHFAHVRGVIHRDLKPENVMLGDYGEVLVMDWGLARRLHQASEAGLNDDSKPTTGQTLGTPAYMPPEQARGDLEEVDELSDIYSLGAILYEILTLSPPYEGKDPLEVMWNVVDKPLMSPSERNSEREVPDELERICLRAMSAEASNRYEDARSFHDDLEAWLEGLQSREADQKVREGERAARTYRSQLEELERLNERVRETQVQVDAWEPLEKKRSVWELEDRRDAAEAAAASAFGQAVTAYTQALAYDPDNDEAQRGLADLYWTRFRRAEMRGDVLDTAYYKALVEQYDPGDYEELLEGRSTLRVMTDPEGATVDLYEYIVRDRQRFPEEPQHLGKTPVDSEQLPVGSYLLQVAAPGRLDCRVPVFLERDRDANVHARLPKPDLKQAGFEYVCGGEYIAGGDPQAFDARPPQRTFVGSFFCKKFPVTFREYLEWFNDLYRRKGEAAMKHAPQTRDAEGLLIRYDPDRGEWVPDEILIEGAARERYPSEEGHEFDLPVLGIRAEDAERYALWRSRRDGVQYRLPTVDEYEKAGRGVDGRCFPWGDEFDATFCKMRFSRPETPPQPEPVGAFSSDESPYGIRDLAGGIREWCRTRSDSVREEDNQRPVKGGGWNQDSRDCRLASNQDVIPEARTTQIGFRLVYDLRDDEDDQRFDAIDPD